MAGVTDTFLTMSLDQIRKNQSGCSIILTLWGFCECEFARICEWWGYLSKRFKG